MAQNSSHISNATFSQQRLPLPVPVNTNAPYGFDNQGFPVQLVWSGNLMGAFAHRRKITAPPGLEPTVDPSIGVVKAHEDLYVRDMIKAFYQTAKVNDNPGYHGITLFTLGHKRQISGYDVEAVCRILFASVINRCENGYSGPDSTNRLVNQGSRFVNDDRDGTCQTRITNIIRTLNDWKCVCKDILFTDSKIESLANAPATVWPDKMEYQVNNDTKKKNQQHERETAATVVIGNDAPRNAKGDLKPLPLPQSGGRRRQRRQEQPEDSTSNSLETSNQTQLDSQPTQASSSASQAQQRSLAMGQSSLTADTDTFLQDPPTYPHPYYGNYMPNYQTYDSNYQTHSPTYGTGNQQQDLSFSPGIPYGGSSSMLPMQPQEQVPSCGIYNGQGPSNALHPQSPDQLSSMIESATYHGSDSLPGGVIESARSHGNFTSGMGGYGAVPAPVFNWSHFSGTNVHNNFNSMTFSPEGFLFGGNYTAAAPGVSTSASAAQVYPTHVNYGAPTRISVSEPEDEYPHASNKKHARTATMDAHLQPQPTRRKRGGFPEETHPDLD